jgi:5'-deoxynucleotidase YfbR-like HD superfamily hydrolase
MSEHEALRLLPSNPELAQEAGSESLDANAALQIFDKFITDIYLPMRGAPGYGTERAIYVARPHVEHRENNMEHMGHVSTMTLIIWDNRKELGIKFPENFDIAKAHRFAQAHDYVELLAPDVDAVTPDRKLLLEKDHHEQLAAKEMKLKYPFFRRIIEDWEEYHRKDNPEAHYVSDIDKLASTRNICMDGGRKWREWEDYITFRHDMCSIYRAKLYTEFGHRLFDEIEKDLDNHPEYFSSENNPQGTLF